MTGWNRSFLMCLCVLYSVVLHGQNAYLNKKVTLPNGRIMLKTALKSISNQTGCVFSYDPTKIADRQSIDISTKGSLSLHAALSAILPKNIQFKMNGKYIVLQEMDKVFPIIKTSPIILPKQTKPSNPPNKGRGTIDKSLTLERLVLPPIQNSTETVPGSQPIDSIPKQTADSNNFAQKGFPVLKEDSNVVVAIIPDTVSKRQPLVNEVLKSDTVRMVKSGFANFITKKGYLEMGVSLNKQLGAISIYPGLYNVYAILSIGSDYHKTYLFGIGAGIHVKVDSHFSFNFDLLQNSIIAGKSYALQVRASNTQVIPVLTYSPGSIFKIFIGPTMNLINSSYISSVSTTDLGTIVGIGFSAGIKVDLKNLLCKRI